MPRRWLGSRRRDLLRIGWLMVNDGRWEGRQVVPQEWVRASVQRHVGQAQGSLAYGYQWWLLPPDDPQAQLPEVKVICGLGMGGQFLLIVHQHRLVLLTHAWHPGRETENNPIRMLYREILPMLSD